MTTLPALPVTYEEAVMSRYVRERIKAVRAGPVDPFSPAAARAWLREKLKVIACHNERSASFVLEMAIVGIEEADDALAELIKEHKARNEELGHALATYDDILFNRGPSPIHPPRGRQNDNFLADRTIRYLVRDLMRQFPGLHLRRRDRTSKQPSYCSIVADAIRGVRLIDEEAVRKIYQARLGPQKSGVVRFVSHQVR